MKDSPPPSPTSTAFAFSRQASEAESSATFHPSYAFPDGDLVLASSDGVNFRVHSLILRLASGFFSGMLDMERAASESAAEPIPVAESAELLKRVLDLAYPTVHLQSVDSKPGSVIPFAALRATLETAEKYEMTSALQNSRPYVLANVKSYPPLEVYALARAFNWSEVAKAASTEVLQCDLDSKASIAILRDIDSDGILQLRTFLRTRKDAFLAALDHMTDQFRWSSSPICCKDVRTICRVRCDIKLGGSPFMAALKYCIWEAIEKCPRGDALRTEQFWDKPEFAPLWDLKCDCQKPALEKEKTMTAILRVLDSLPNTI